MSRTSNKTHYRTLALALAMGCGLMACGGGGGEQSPIADADIAEGAKLFRGTCATCHGPNGAGVPNLGKDMRGSEWIAGQSEAELVEFLKQGRKATHPLNTTGIDMPPRGGNPNFSDEDLAKIVKYIRTL